MMTSCVSIRCQRLRVKAAKKFFATSRLPPKTYRSPEYLVALTCENAGGRLYFESERGERPLVR